MAQPHVTMEPSLTRPDGTVWPQESPLRRLMRYQTQLVLLKDPIVLERAEFDDGPMYRSLGYNPRADFERREDARLEIEQQRSWVVAEINRLIGLL